MQANYALWLVTSLPLGAESKVQVYENIHTFLQENLDVTTQLGIYICTSLNKEVEMFRFKNLYGKFMYVEQ